jgi:hypothetical protein
MLAKIFVEFKKWDLEIQVPEDFLVHASGRVRASRKENGDVIFRVQQHAAVTPFVVAGRYQQQIVSASIARSGTRHLIDRIVFWTLQPLSADTTHEASIQIAQLIAAYDHIFGARARAPNTIWIVECMSGSEPVLPSASSDVSQGADAVCSLSLPDTVLLPSVAWANGVASKAFKENVNRSLAQLWLGPAAASRPAQNDFSLSGIYAYAAHAALLDEPGQNRPQQNDSNLRRTLIARYLAEYDKKWQHQHEDAEKFVPSPPSIGTNPLREPTLEKSVLFFFALEDQYGSQPVHRAIARIVHALGEQGYNRNDLRSALEAETQKNAADFFRQWFDESGIPKDFCARYRNRPDPAGKSL